MVKRLSLQKDDIKENLSIILLCAGKGVRLKRISKNIPKPLIKIDGIPILQKTLNNLIKLEINQIVIVIGHLGNLIEDFVLKIKKRNNKLKNKLSIIDTEDQYELGPLYSFLSITKNKDVFIENQYYLLMPGDTIFDFEILKEVISIVSHNTYKVKKYPFVFYREVDSRRLKKQYKSERKISFVRNRVLEAEVYLKRIFQLKIKNFSKSDIMNQMVPIFIIPYHYIKDLLNLKDKVAIDTIWELINYFIDKKMKILAFKINSKYNFYDIDYKYDIKKKRKGQ
jgi:NDP-sugar pyrophosphorylase family protein